MLLIILFLMTVFFALFATYSLFSKKYRYYHSIGFLIVAVALFVGLVSSSMKQVEEHALIQITQALDDFAATKTTATSVQDGVDKKIFSPSLVNDPYFTSQLAKYSLSFTQNEFSVAFDKRLPFIKSLCMNISENVKHKNQIKLNNQTLDNLSTENRKLACEQDSVIFKSNH